MSQQRVRSSEQAEQSILSEIQKEISDIDKSKFLVYNNK